MGHRPQRAPLHFPVAKRIFMAVTDVVSEDPHSACPSGQIFIAVTDVVSEDPHSACPSGQIFMAVTDAAAEKPTSLRLVKRNRPFCHRPAPSRCGFVVFGAGRLHFPPTGPPLAFGLAAKHPADLTCPHEPGRGGTRGTGSQGRLPPGLQRLAHGHPGAGRPVRRSHR